MILYPLVSCLKMTNDFKRLEERATIMFPKPLSLEETHKLIEHICKNLPGRANYHCGYHMSVGHPFVDEDFYNERGTVDLAGIISRADGTALDGFNGIISRLEDTSKFAAFRFQTIPGYEEYEYRVETLKLWEDVKKLASDYFSQ